MSSVPSISVVIAGHNCASFLGETLRSVRAQTLADWECVVVDDGSTDGTAGVAEAFAREDRRVRVVRQANAGPCVARNHGYRETNPRSAFVTFMDADDVWSADALGSLAAELGRHPEAVGAHGLGEFIDEAGRPYLPGAFAALGRGRLGCRGGWPRPWPADRPTTFETVVTASVVFPPGLILTRRSAYERVGLFDPDMRYAEDWDLLIRLARVGDLRFLDRVILGYRRHANNVGTSPDVPGQCARVQHKAFFSPLNSPTQRRIVRDSWRASQVMTLRDRAAAARGHARDRRYLQSLMTLGRLPFIAYRYLRGYPRPLPSPG